MLKLTVKENQLIVDLMTILALKLILLPRPESDNQIRLATISIASAARTYINDELLRPAVESIQEVVKKAVNNDACIKMAEGYDTLRQKLGELKELLQQKTGPVKRKAISNFIYRYAYKLASMAGKEFANIGRNVSADDAGVLLLIREILEIQEKTV